MSVRDRDAPQLRAVAPLVTATSPRRLVGPIALVANGPRVIGVTSSELLRPLQHTPLVVATRLDGSATVPVASWMLGRYSGLALVELGGPVPANHDAVPLDIGAVCASLDTRGAPAALATITGDAAPYTRLAIDVHVDADDGAGMSDFTRRFATPVDAANAAHAVEGAALFAWFPPDPALGRPSEILAVAVAIPVRADLVRPRGGPVIAELVGLDDLGRALLGEVAHEERSELVPRAGEFEDRELPDPAVGDS